MYKLKFFLIFISLFGLTSTAWTKPAKEDQILIVQNLINQAYKLGYVDAAPVEMNFVEKKVIQAREAKKNRKKKIFADLIAQIKADLKIVKKRYDVNKLNKQLTKLQQDNLESKKMLDDLKRQL